MLFKGLLIVLLHVILGSVLHDIHGEDAVEGNLDRLGRDEAARSERSLGAEIGSEAPLNFLCSNYFQGLIPLLGILEHLPDLVLALEEGLGSNGSHEGDDDDA